MLSFQDTTQGETAKLELSCHLCVEYIVTKVVTFDFCRTNGAYKAYIPFDEEDCCNKCMAKYILELHFPQAFATVIEGGKT